MEFVELEDSLLEDGEITIEDESVLALDLKRNKIVQLKHILNII